MYESFSYAFVHVPSLQQAQSLALHRQPSSLCLAPRWVEGVVLPFLAVPLNSLRGPPGQCMGGTNSRG